MLFFLVIYLYVDIMIHMLKIKNKFFKAIISLIILISPSLILAEGEDFALITPPVAIYDKGLIGFLEIVISGITLLAVPIIVLAFVYAGFMLVFATGNSDKLQKAKTTF